MLVNEVKSRVAVVADVVAGGDVVWLACLCCCGVVWCGMVHVLCYSPPRSSLMMLNQARGGHATTIHKNIEERENILPIASNLLEGRSLGSFVDCVIRPVYGLSLRSATEASSLGLVWWKAGAD